MCAWTRTRLLTDLFCALLLLLCAAINELERLSSSLKATLHTPQQFKEIPSLPQDPKSKQQLLETLNFSIAALKAQALTPEASGVAAEGELQTKVQDIAQLQHVLSLVGVSLGGAGGDENVLKLQLSIQRLVKSQAALEAARPKVAGQGILTLASARFWGIIRGTKRDYYVVEATRHKYPVLPNGGRSVILNAKEIADQKKRRKDARAERKAQKAALQAAQDAKGEDDSHAGDEIETPRPPKGVLKEKTIKPIWSKNENHGQGANAFIYFVTNTIEAKVAGADGESTSSSSASSFDDAGSRWSLLPDLDPKHVAASKSMRRLLTGDLNAPVLGFPKFEGLEADYLRTQIARISASTLISPANFHTVEENAEGIETVVEDREYEPTAPEELIQPAGWVHHRAHLLRAGRISVWEEPEKEEDEEEQEEDEEEEEEEEPEPEPEEEEEEEPDEPLPLLSSVEEDTSKGVKALWSFRCYPKIENPHATVLARSTLWPGAVAAAKKDKAVAIYIGDAQKYLPLGFTPAPPPKIQSEFVPVFNAEEEEPNPLQEQVDPAPPAEEPEEGEGSEEGSGEDEEDDDEQEEAGGGGSDDEDN